jgi:hypothetical protein
MMMSRSTPLLLFTMIITIIMVMLMMTTTTTVVASGEARADKKIRKGSLMDNRQMKWRRNQVDIPNIDGVRERERFKKLVQKRDRNQSPQFDRLSSA